MKRLLIFIIIGVVALLIGVGGGIFVGVTYFGGPETPKQGAGMETPGPVVPLGDFTVNLADKESHLVVTKISLEASSQKAMQIFVEPGWLPRMRSDIVLILKDRRYDDLRNAEGMLALGQDIKRRLNALLPLAEGKPPVVRVLFEEFILQ